MRISNIEWLKKRIGFIRKLGEQTARQRQIIDLLDNEAGLTEQERNHRLFLAAGLLIEAGLVDTKTGELRYKKDRILQALKEIKYDLETSPNPDA